MPPWIDYGLSQNDVGDLVNFIRSINLKPKEAVECQKQGYRPTAAPAPAGSRRPRRTPRPSGSCSARSPTSSSSGSSPSLIAAKFVWPELLGTVSVAHLRAAAPAARQRHALRLAAGRRHGPRLLPGAAAVRREAVEREARASPPRCSGTSSSWARWSRLLAGCNQGLEYAELPLLARRRWWWWPGSCSASTSSPPSPRRKYHADVRLALVHHGHDPLDGLRLPDRQLRRAVRHRASTRPTSTGSTSTTRSA